MERVASNGHPFSMDKSDIKKLAEILGASLSTTTKNWNGISCPLAGIRHTHGTDTHPSFRVKISPGKTSRMRCFSCGWGGTLYELIFELKHNKIAADIPALLWLAEKESEDSGLTLEAPEEDNDHGQIHPFSEFWLESFPTVFNSGLALHYLEKRRTPKAISAMLDLRWDPGRDRVCFPYRTNDKTLVGLHGRSVKPADLPYLAYTYGGKSNPQCWVGEEWVDFDKPIVVTESVFDLSRVLQVYRNAITCRTANVTAVQMDRILEAGYIVTLFDPDKAGAQARKYMQSYMLGKSPYLKMSHVHLPDEKDGGDLTMNEMASELEIFLNLDPKIS